MKKTIFTGAGVAIVTPMNADGSINFDKLGELIDFNIDNGTDAIIICGTTGESATMTDEEHIECIRYAVEKTNHRIPVIAGTGSNHTEYAVNLSKKAEELGADALLCVTPYYNKTSQAGLIAHFSAIAKAVTLPIILYNVPSRTGVNILPETCRELAKIDNIVAIKAASGNISQITQVAALCGDDLDIYQATTIRSFLSWLWAERVLFQFFPTVCHLKHMRSHSSALMESTRKQEKRYSRPLVLQRHFSAT